MSGIDLSTVRSLASLNLKPVELPPEMRAQMEEVWRGQFRVPVGKPDNHPDNIYATVKRNGEVIATLYNSGTAETSNAAHARVKNLPSMGESETRIGPRLAQARAEEIAKAMGGTIEKASTALTPSQWRPRGETQWTYDYDAMTKAMAEREAQMTASRLARLQFETQLIGQTG